MGLNMWNGYKNNLFKFDGWRKVTAKKSSVTFTSDGWQNKVSSSKSFKVHTDGWKNSITL
ncbi:hypothetical protein [Psychrilyobacter atlanticus]|uniref:hypothetical protein n=1 Tax=Psychrilyobacter atlanticus TaxID=271091 RepID=UPI00041983F7|nr:hypothetical protein [Psychrilyobacter atlanticus]